MSTIYGRYGAAYPWLGKLALAPARRFFELSAGRADDHYNAYHYMVLTVPARPDAYIKIPAVVHRDGTARVQNVREEENPFTYAYLNGMGRRLGVEVSVNTSLNVGRPIVQTPSQALGALKRVKALSGLVMIADDGQTWFAWHAVTPCPEAVKQWTAPRASDGAAFRSAIGLRRNECDAGRQSKN